MFAPQDPEECNCEEPTVVQFLAVWVAAGLLKLYLGIRSLLKRRQ
jgi:hypothetical protein